MYITQFRAHNYRNIAACTVDFLPGLNVLVGDNAQGKTNALESIYLFARGKSFRAVSDEELVRFGETGFSCAIEFVNRERTQTLYYGYQDGQRTRKRNGVTLDRAAEMIGHFRAVLFCPDHLQLVKGAPQERRGFLNVALSQTSPRYLQQYADYVRLLNHRNCLLKQARKGLWYDPEELETWSRQLSVRAAELHCQRAAFVKQIEGFAQKILLDLSGGRETLTLSYDSEGRGETLEELTRSYQTLLTGNYRQEMAAGCSLYGVHRDDMGIAINGAPARVYASQGQQRSVVLALKMAEGEVSRECCGEYPVFLFDDVLSELDEGRRAYVFADGGDKQFILTSCEGLSGKAHQIQVEKGQYVSTHR